MRAASRPSMSVHVTTRACFTERSTIPTLDPGGGRLFRRAGRIGSDLPGMKRSIVVMVVLASTAAGAVFAYQTAARQRDYRALLARGDLALKQDETFGAIEAYSGAIALRSDSMLAYLRRGETYARRGDRGD